jgi:nicotinamide-nucleotide amidase
VVGGLLRQRGETLAVVESCTGGLLAQRITSVAGSSEYFCAAIIAYQEPMKTALAGVSAELLAREGAVSSAAAAALASGCRERTGATYSLAVTGYAGPAGGTADKPVGTVYIALAAGAGCEVYRRRFLGDRERVREFAAQASLDLLRRRLAGLPAPAKLL